MIIGVCLKISNSIYRKNMLDLFCEAIPELIFLTSLFGYMVFVIILKWCIVYIK